MQLPLPGLASESHRRAEPLAVVVEGQTFPVTIARHRRARRYLLRVTDDGAVRLTVPRGASVAGGLRFAATQAAWISEQWSRLHSRISWTHGTSVWYRGVETALELTNGWIRLGDLVMRRERSVDLRACVQSHLRRVASQELPVRCRELGDACGRAPVKIVVRDQRSRWGSCSTRGTITLNWRLLQMPPSVADYVMRHELAHLVHPNHSRRFWRAVEAICPDWRDAERWLRRHGRELL